MKIKTGNCRIHEGEIIFLIAYICFFISLFIGDIGINSGKIRAFSKIWRYISYIASFIQLWMHKGNSKRLVAELTIFVITMMFFVFTKDIYLPMLVILIIGSRDSSEKKICKISLAMLIGGTVLTVLGNMVGFIPDIMTAKAFSTEMTRHSYGFNHSNVLPNNLLMIEILMAWTFKEHITKRLIVIFFLVHVGIYYLTMSRMSLMIGLLLTVGLLVLKVRMFSKVKKALLDKIAYVLTIFYSSFSIIMMFLVNENALVNRIDLVFSNRFWAAFLKMKNVGFKIFNFNSNEFFYHDEIVLDNGYLFITMRYGLIALLAVNIISIVLIKRYKKQPYNILCIICVFSISFIDNLFLSYRFLPFMIFAFLNMKMLKNNSEIS